MPLIDTAGDTGKWVAAILADFPKYKGQVLCCATALYSFEEIVEAMSRASGKKVVYKQFSLEVWREFLPPLMRDHIAEMLQYFEEYGYYGENTEGKVQWSAKQAQGRLSTLDDYLQANPLDLQ